jgi:hypothetical protein
MGAVLGLDAAPGTVGEVLAGGPQAGRVGGQGRRGVVAVLVPEPDPGHRGHHQAQVGRVLGGGQDGGGGRPVLGQVGLDQGHGIQPGRPALLLGHGLGSSAVDPRRSAHPWDREIGAPDGSRS